MGWALAQSFTIKDIEPTNDTKVDTDGQHHQIYLEVVDHHESVELRKELGCKSEFSVMTRPVP
jgi:hypothetical protein